MGKGYYCDYCDKSFADNPVNRKNHISGVVHNGNKKAHYDAVKDEQQILKDDSFKKPCRAFLSTGECRFADRCQYSHMTSEARAKLIRRIDRKKKAADQKVTDRKKMLTGALDKWLEKYDARKAVQAENEDQPGTSQNNQHCLDSHIPEYEIADCLKLLPSIPPSLLPPSRNSILEADYTDWG